MKNKLTILFGFILTVVVYGQDDAKGTTFWDNQFMMSWDMAFPTDNEFLDKTGVYGIRFDYRALGNKNVAFGFSSGWNSYRQKVEKQLYESSDGSRMVYTDMIRRVFELPFTLNGYYYFGASSAVKPYLGVGVGAMFSQQEAHFNVYALKEKNWGFLVRPELGIQLYFRRDLGMQLYGVYSYATNKNDSFGVNHLEHLGLGAGMFWSF